jgi:hypothetical protein
MHDTGSCPLHITLRDPLQMRWTQRDAKKTYQTRRIKKRKPEPAASSSCLTRMETCADPPIHHSLSSHYSARSFGSPGRSYSPPSIPFPSSTAETRRCCEARLAQARLLGKRPKWNGSLCFYFTLMRPTRRETDLLSPLALSRPSPFACCLLSYVR